MSVTLPNSFRESLLNPMDKNQWSWCVRIAVPGETIRRLTDNNEEVTYDSVIYSPDDLEVGARDINSSGSIPTVTLRTSALNTTIYDLIQDTSGAESAMIELIKVNNDFLSESIPALEVDYENLATKCDSDWIYFTLGAPNPMHKRIPLRSFSSSICPNADPVRFKKSRCRYSGTDTSCTGTFEDCYGKGNGEHWGGFIGLDNSSMEV